MKNMFRSYLSKGFVSNGVILLLWFFVSHSVASEERNSSGKPLKKAATFHFPEYAYKETSKNEITYREFEVLCEQAATCEELVGVAKVGCVRKCISNSCYSDIYAFDELETGEIDVRLNSFKGCVIQRCSRTSRL